MTKGVWLILSFVGGNDYDDLYWCWRWWFVDGSIGDDWCGDSEQAEVPPNWLTDGIIGDDWCGANDDDNSDTALADNGTDNDPWLNEQAEIPPSWLTDWW